MFLDSRQITIPVEPAASSIPRYELDAALLRAARSAGVDVREEIPVRDVRAGTNVTTTIGEFTAKAVINASGRWSQLTQRESPDTTKWIGLKAHFNEEPAPQSVDLYFFPGGYCGVQPIDGQGVNVCAMVQASAARSLEEVFALHPELQHRSRDWQQRFPTVTTSGLRFRNPRTEDRGMLLAGDAAAFIDPFAGDGISLALHGGVDGGAGAHALFAKKGFSCAGTGCLSHDLFTAACARFAERIADKKAAGSAGLWLRAGVMTLVGNRMIGKMLVRETRARG